jgi:hypothetical protein
MQYSTGLSTPLTKESLEVSHQEKKEELQEILSTDFDN